MLKSTEVEKIAITFFGAMALATSIYMGFQVYTQRQCLAKGWPAAKVTILLEPYCVKRVDQTDVVLPLAQIP
jgi:hypothetical protein